MQLSVTFRHMEATEALKRYVGERFERIKKYFPDPISVHVVMSTIRYNHRVDVNVQLHNGFQIAGRETTENMYSSIDLVVAKIERQVRRYKDKLQTHKTKSNFAPVPWTHSVLVHEEPTTAASETASLEDSSVTEPKVVERTERFHANPMSVVQARMQLDLLDEQFLVFRNQDSGGVNVIYRREDGSYGLIETQGPDVAHNKVG